MTEKLILITVMHENTPYFFIFPFFEIFRGLLPPCPPPHGAIRVKITSVIQSPRFTNDYEFGISVNTYQ